MNKASLLTATLAGAGVAVVASSFSAAHAASMGSAFSMTNFTGDTAEVKVLLTETKTGVKFDVSIVQPPTINGDLFGFYGSVLNDNVSAITGITGTDITKTQIAANSVINLGGGNNLNGYSGTSFDFGVTFLTSGCPGGICLEQTSFTVGGLTLADFQNQTFGARLQSTGDNLNGSSKLSGDFTGETTVPEPITLFGTGAAIGFGVLFRRRQAQLDA